MRNRVWLLVALVATSSVSTAKSTNYWICAGADGVRAAQDRPCDATQTTIRKPPLLTAPAPATTALAPSPPPQAVTSKPAPLAVSTAPTGNAASKPVAASIHQPILDTAVRGLGLITLLLVLIFGARAAVKITTTPRRSARRQAMPPSIEQRSSGLTKAHKPTVDRIKQASDSVAAPSRTAVLDWNLELLRSLDWKRFEELCQRYWLLKGFAAELTGPGADEGIDVRIASRESPHRTFAVVQCKAWADQAVDVETVRALWGARAHFEATLGLVYGISGFTEPARRFAEGKHLKLIDGPELLRQIAALSATEQHTLLAAITRGDYTTPSCAQCESRLVVRPNRPGWWSCPQYPKCRYQGIRLRKSLGA